VSGHHPWPPPSKPRPSFDEAIEEIEAKKAPNEYRFAVDWDGTCVEDVWPGMGDWLPGAVEALRELDSIGEVVIHTVRVAPLSYMEAGWRHHKETREAIQEIEKMLEAEGLGHIEVWTRPYKPPAVVYIDDKAMTFRGNWPETVYRAQMKLGMKRLEDDCEANMTDPVDAHVSEPWLSNENVEVVELDAQEDTFRTLLDKVVDVLDEEPETILQEADRLVSNDRRQDYGHPLDDFSKVAAAAKALEIDPTSGPDHHALYMVIVKIAREVNRPKRDNRVDGAGYFKCLDMIIEERERRGE
jgi:Domain of unknown function (DUF6378)